MPITGDWETGLRDYFAQTPDLIRVELDSLRPGRSGASVLFATPWAWRGGQDTRLQQELVKLANLSSGCNLKEEIDKFRCFAEGVDLVYGQRLARSPYLNHTGDGLGVFGYPLFEAGGECSPYYAVALADPASAIRALTTFLEKLLEWYGPTNSTADVPLNLKNEKRTALFDNLKRLDAGSAEKFEKLLDDVACLPGGTSRVHGDLHLENILVERGGERPYLIDFGSAMEQGSPCADLARLESDLIYRLLPYNYTPDEVAEFEKAAWDGTLTDRPPTIAGALVARVRHHAQGLLSTQNATIWYLVGRLLNGMRMLAGTWHEVIPYGDLRRREGILASLRVVGKRLENALEGRRLQFTLASPCAANPADAECSLRWLFIQRRYGDAWALAREVADAHRPARAAVCLLGALAGLSGEQPPTEVDKLSKLRPNRLNEPYTKGLKALLDVMRANRTTSGAMPAKTIRDFEIACKLFTEADDQHLFGIAKDQLARAEMRRGDFERAKVLFAEAIAVKKKSGDDIGLATSLGGQALLHLRTLEYAEAGELFRQDLRLACDQRDVAAQVKIHNWLGQALLEENLTNVSIALGHFLDSIKLAEGSRSATYDPELDVAFAKLGCGCCYTRTDAVPIAEAAEHEARMGFERVVGRNADLGLALTELLAGEIAYLKSQARTGLLRLQSGLRAIAEAGGPLLVLDHGVRACRFLRRIDRQEACRSLVREVRVLVKKIDTLKIHEVLTELESES